MQYRWFTKFCWFLLYQVLLISAVQQSDSVVHIHAFLFKNLLFHYGLSWDSEYSSLCCTVVGLHCLSLPYVKACICSARPPPPITRPPPWQQPVCSLCLQFCFWFLGMLTCVVFVSFVSLLFLYTVLHNLIIISLAALCSMQNLSSLTASYFSFHI